MFQTTVGATGGPENVAYLRPETAQGIFLNYKNVLDTTRVKVPFGIAQIGKAFRNEVTPRNYIFRSREFEQMEMEWFCHPDDAEKWFKFWVDYPTQLVAERGRQSADNLVLRKHDQDELAHYAKCGAGTYDVEYRYPFSGGDGFGGSRASRTAQTSTSPNIKSTAARSSPTSRTTLASATCPTSSSPRAVSLAACWCFCARPTTSTRPSQP